MTQNKYELVTYETVAKTYTVALKASLFVSLGEAWQRLYGVPEPAPPLLIDGKLQLFTRVEAIRQGRGPTQGLSLKVFAKTDSKSSRLMRTENVKPDMSRAEQARILEAMCDIIAIHQQTGYRLIKPVKTMQPARKVSWPSKI